MVLKDRDTRIGIPISSKKILVNGQVYTSDVKPEVINGRAMLPVTNIARVLGPEDGRDTIWNGQTMTVTIYWSILVHWDDFSMKRI